MSVLASSRFALHRLCAIACAVAVVALAACTTPPAPPPPAPPVAVQPPAPHQLSADQPTFFKLPNLAPDKTPVRVGIILPFSNSSANVKSHPEICVPGALCAAPAIGTRIAMAEANTEHLKYCNIRI